MYIGPFSINYACNGFYVSAYFFFNTLRALRTSSFIWSLSSWFDSMTTGFFSKFHIFAREIEQFIWNLFWFKFRKLVAALIGTIKSYVVTTKKLFFQPRFRKSDTFRVFKSYQMQNQKENHAIAMKTMLDSVLFHGMHKK